MIFWLHVAVEVRYIVGIYRQGVVLLKSYFKNIESLFEDLDFGVSPFDPIFLISLMRKFHSLFAFDPYLINFI